MFCGLHTYHIYYTLPGNLIIRLQNIMEVPDVAHWVMTQNIFQPNDGTVATVVEGLL